jgi:hypothetical protein
MELLIVLASLLFFFIGRWSVSEDRLPPVKRKVEELKRELNKPHSGPIKRPNTDDLRRRDPEYKALLSEWDKVVPDEVTNV